MKAGEKAMEKKQQDDGKKAVGQEVQKTDLEESRKAKLKKLIERGVDLFPSAVDITHRVNDIVLSYTEEEKEKLSKQLQQALH